MKRCSSASGLGLRRTSLLPGCTEEAAGVGMARLRALSSKRLGLFMGILRRADNGVVQGVCVG